MPITVPANTTKYVPIYSSAWYIFTVPIASASLVPTRPEMALATTYDVTAAIAEHNGFTTSRESITEQIYGSTGFPVSLSGAKQVEATSLELWADRTGADLRAVLTESLAIDVMFLPGGDVAASKAEVWRCSVNSRSVPKAKSAIARIRVGLDIQNANENVTIPA